MKIFTATKARAHLSQVLRLAEQGEEIEIVHENGSRFTICQKEEQPDKKKVTNPTVNTNFSSLRSEAKKSNALIQTRFTG